MKVFLKEITFESKKDTYVKNFTEEVRKSIKKSKVINGLVMVSSKHTTFGIIVNEISEKTGIEKIVVQTTVEAFMKSIRTSMTEGKNVYLRGFGTFVVKKRAEKVGRNISKNTTVVIPAHFIPAFKPAKTFSERVKRNVKVAEPLDNKQVE